MTLSSTTSKNNYTANGTQTVFAYQFRIDDQAHLQVFVNDVLQAAGYTVSGVGQANGGNVTFASAPAASAKVTLLRKVPLTQPLDLPSQGAFPSDSVETRFDQQTMVDQQLQEQIDRSVVSPPSSSVTGLALPAPQATTLLGWNGAATGLQNYAASTLGGVTPTPYMLTLLDDADSASAQRTLDVGGALDLVLATNANYVAIGRLDEDRDILEAGQLGFAGAWVAKARAAGLSWLKSRMVFAVRQSGADAVIEAWPIVNPNAATVQTVATLTGCTATDISDVRYGELVVTSSNAGLWVIDLKGGSVQTQNHGASVLGNANCQEAVIGLSQMPLRDARTGTPIPYRGAGMGAGAVTFAGLKDNGGDIKSPAGTVGNKGTAIAHGILFHTNNNANDTLDVSRPLHQTATGNNTAANVIMGNAGGSSMQVAPITGGIAVGSDLIAALSTSGVVLRRGFNEARKGRLTAMSAVSDYSGALALLTDTYNTSWYPSGLVAQSFLYGAFNNVGTKANWMLDRTVSATNAVEVGAALTITQHANRAWKIGAFAAGAHITSTQDLQCAPTETAMFHATVELPSGAPATEGVILSSTGGGGGRARVLFDTAGRVEFTMGDGVTDITALLSLTDLYGQVVDLYGTYEGPLAQVRLWAVAKNGLVVKHVEASTAGLLGNVAVGSTTMIGYQATFAAFTGSIFNVGWFRAGSTRGQLSHQEVIANATDHLAIIGGAECLLPGGVAYDCITVDPMRGDRATVGRNGNLATIDGLKVTSVTISGLAGGALSTDIDKVKAWRGGYAVKTGTGQLYVSEPARDIAEEIATIGHNGGPPLNAPAAFDGIQIWRNAAQNVATATTTIMEFDLLKHDSRPDEHLLEGPNDSRLRVPHGVTRFRASVEVDFGSNATGLRQFWFEVSSGVTVLPTSILAPINGSNTRPSAATHWVEVKAGDYITLKVHQTSGGALSVYAYVQIEWGR